MQRLVLLILVSTVIFACTKPVPGFDEAKAFELLVVQCEIGPRFPGSEEIELCRNLIINELSKHNAQIEEQHFSAIVQGKEIEGVNIIASYYPRMSRRILLAAHYDTRPWADKESDPALHNSPILGANDAASGVAVLLELAAVIDRQEPAQYGIDLIFFDLEDMGEYDNNESWCLGSQYFADHYHKKLPEKAIVLDMIGDADLQIDMEYLSYHNSPELVNEVWNIAKELGFSEFQPRITKRIFDDHIPLITAGFEAVDIIDFEYPAWHTLQDTPDKCSAHSLYVVGQTLLNLIYREK
ncbi:MAG: M28 family peptidase [Candidatus Cloacimonadales bacterium]|nr:M28 family peptidase [Candidatus Cloacimonadales bacterium]